MSERLLIVVGQAATDAAEVPPAVRGLIDAVLARFGLPLTVFVLAGD